MTQAPASLHPEVHQPSLFDSVAPAAVLTPTQKAEFATAVEALLREIAAALAGTTARERDHE